MTELTNKYLELNVINTNDKIIDGVLEYKGLNLVEDPEYSKLNIWKWTVTNDNFPTFLPTIINPIKKEEFNKPYIPPNNNITESDINYTSAPFNIENYYFTDWKISICQTDYTTNPTGIKTWYGTYVSFPRDIKFGPTNIEYDENNNFVSEDSLLQNKFFWGNSTILCDMITNAFDRMSFSVFKFVKNGEYWSILASTALFNGSLLIDVYFNEPMMRFFQFPYRFQDGAIPLISDVITTINNADYRVISTTKSSTALFPFSSIIFTFDSGLNAFPYFISNNDDKTNENPEDNILTSFTLNITDINQIGNCLEFVADTKDKSISLTDSKMRPFKIKTYLVTKTSKRFLLKLKKYDSINLLLMFS